MPYCPVALRPQSGTLFLEESILFNAFFLHFLVLRINSYKETAAGHVAQVPYGDTTL